MVGPLGLILSLLLKIILQSLVWVGLMGLVLLGTYIILLLVVNNGLLINFGSANISGEYTCSAVYSLSFITTPISVMGCSVVNTYLGYPNGEWCQYLADLSSISHVVFRTAYQNGTPHCLYIAIGI